MSVAAEGPRKGQVMFAKLKAWAAALWLSIKFELNGGRETQLIDQLRDALDREKRYKEQAERWQALFESKCDEIREIVKASDDCVRLRDKTIAAHEAECRRLNVIRKGLEEGAAILVRRHKEDAAKIEELRGQVERANQFHEQSNVKRNELLRELKAAREIADQYRELIESRDKQVQDLTVSVAKYGDDIQVLAAERDKHMRAAAEWQGQCKRMTLELEVSRSIIADTKNAVGTLNESWQKLLTAIENAIVSTPGNTSAIEQAPEPEIATIGDVLAENRRRALAEVMFGRNTAGVESTIRPNGPKG